MIISVIIPCYNEKNTIEKIIDRIKQLKDLEIEIIIIDDYSTDGKRILQQRQKYKIEFQKYCLMKKISVKDIV